MWTWLGWLALLAAAALGYWYARQRTEGGATRRPEEIAQERSRLVSAIVVGVVGLLLLAIGSQARPTLKLTYATDFQKDPQWLKVGGDDRVGWDASSGRYHAKLEVGSGHYACVPVDWDANAFRAEWDMTVTALPEKPVGAAKAMSVIAVGLCDGSISNIEDTDHVGGSTIQATFTPDDIHLRTSDTNLIVRSDSMKLRGAREGVKVEMGKTYHCVLGYEDATDTAALQVSEAGSTSPLVSLQVPDLRDFSPNVSYLSITVKGYNRFKPEKQTSECYIDNVRFYQP
jgi:hypothetical protein